MTTAFNTRNILTTISDAATVIVMAGLTLTSAAAMAFPADKAEPVIYSLPPVVVTVKAPVIEQLPPVIVTVRRAAP
jgi:hypothetical protein